MDTGRAYQYNEWKAANKFAKPKEDKFDLVSCSVKGVFCKEILREINEFYAESEQARINKEYQMSAEFLQKAYAKTFLLKESSCALCVELFQKSISRAMETMHEEVHDMSVGFFHKKRYEQIYDKLSAFVRKMKSFTAGEISAYSTNESRIIS